MPIMPPTVHFNFPSIPMDPHKIIALNASLMGAGVGYETGPGVGKVEPISLQVGDSGFPDAIDCSGEAKWLVWHATSGTVDLPDGSVNQHDWVRAHGFKLSSVEAAGMAQDGAVRIAFLPPDSPLGPGERHVMIIPGDGLTCESHGSRGPDRRRFASLSFAKYCTVYVLTPPIR